MGCSTSTAKLDEASKVSRSIDEELRQVQRDRRRTVKTLLLGPGESGKSTVVKQLRLVYARPYALEERLNYKEIVFQNTLQSAQVVLEGFATLNMELPPELNSAVTLLQHVRVDAALCRSTGAFDSEISQAITAIWRQPATKQVVEQGSTVQLNDSATYFFEEILRTSCPDYVPNDADILRCRVRSTGIVEETFQVGNTEMVVCDVGGQRSERRKWVSCFEGVQVLIFVAAVSEFDQVLYEDREQPRLEESLLLWQSVVNSPWFSRTSLVLFLNKIDLLRRKVRSRPDLVALHLPDYLGAPDDPTAVMHHLSQRFNRLHGPRNRPFFSHFTCATDTTMMRPIFRAVMDSVIVTSLAEGGFL